MPQEEFAKLKKKYPTQLAELSFIGCESGWASLIDEMLTKLQDNIPADNLKHLHFTCIKEKFGALRAYHHYDAHEDEGASEVMRNIVEIVSFYCDKSCDVCESCGKPGRIVELGGWAQSLCDEHIVQRINKKSVWTEEQSDYYNKAPSYRENGHHYIKLDDLDEASRVMFLQHVERHVHPPWPDTAYAFYFHHFVEMQDDPIVGPQMERDYLERRLRETGSLTAGEEDETSSL